MPAKDTDMDIVTETVERLEKKRVRDERAFGLGSTEGGLKLISSYFSEYETIIDNHISQTKGNSGLRGRLRETLEVDTKELTLAFLMAGVSSLGVVSFTDPETAFSNALRYIGRAMEHLCYGHALRVWDRKQADAWENQLKRATTLAYRQRLLKRKAKEKGFVYPEWEDRDHVIAGKWVTEALLQGPMFALDDNGHLTLTEASLASLDAIMEGLVFAGAFVRPQTVEPEPWAGTATHIEGFRHTLIRTHQKAVQKFMEREFKAGRMGPTLEALNHAQGVRWRINEPMLDLVKQAYELDLGIPGLPRKTSLPVPALQGAWEDMSEDEQKVFLKTRNDIKTANKGFIGERIILSRDIATAEGLRGQTFWTHMNLDYRGRVYGMPHFNFQRSDAIRAMFMFEEGQVLNSEGRYWLKVHLATCGAFGKVDKAPFAERVRWVNINKHSLYYVAKDPLANRMWMEADSPFLFVAACKALLDDHEGKPVHIPVSFDGSCSGLQHLCAMTRAPEGRLVNLTPNERPQDVYQVVADRVKERIEADLADPELSTYAKLFVDYGINRSLVKRNVMTYSYSSRKSGMKDQIMDDTMKPLRFKVMTGDLEGHPFGSDFMQQFEAARYLASHTFEAIEEVVERPAEAMRFLQSVARLYAHEGKAPVWHTPLGFPVMLRYPNVESKRLRLFLYDKGIRSTIMPRSTQEAPGINKRKTASGIAPSYVHSMDACHLMTVLLACKESGINSVALVHDSFGCLPNDAPRFRELIKRTFRDLYQSHDVLEEFRREAIENLDKSDKVPEAPTKGSLDLEAIMQADYCFA